MTHCQEFCFLNSAEGKMLSWGGCMITGPLQWKAGGLLTIWGSLGPYKNRQRRIATMAETVDSDHRG